MQLFARSQACQTPPSDFGLTQSLQPMSQFFYIWDLVVVIGWEYVADSNLKCHKITQSRIILFKRKILRKCIKMQKRVEGNLEVHGEETGVWEEQQAKTVSRAWSRNAPAGIDGTHIIQSLILSRKVEGRRRRMDHVSIL